MKDLKNISEIEIKESEEYVVVIKEWQEYGGGEMIMNVVVGKGSEILDRIKEYDENDFEVYKM